MNGLLKTKSTSRMNRAKPSALLQLAVYWRVGLRRMNVSPKKEITMFALRRTIIGTAIIGLAAMTQYLLAYSPEPNESKVLDRGRYLVKIAGCNDCHTPGYAQAGGEIAEERWLVGDQLGWRGPWGTTYPRNLRLYMQSLSEEQWIKIANTARFRPPMPWRALHDMTTQDLRAIYRFIKYLGPAGQPAPAFVPPPQKPKGPYVQFPGSHK